MVEALGDGRGNDEDGRAAEADPGTGEAYDSDPA